MKGVIRLAGCAVCAIVMSVGCWVAGQQFKVSEAEVMFRDAQRHLAEEQTPEVFAAHYGKLLAKGFSGRARSLAVLYWWLVEDPAVKADIFSDEAWMRGIFPLRVGGPVTNLTIVSIEVCTNAIKFRAEWPLTLSIPCGWLELRAKLGLTEEEWDFLACVIVDPGEGYVEFELPFEEDSILWYYMDEVFAPMAFFKLVVHDPEGWWWPNDGEPEEGVAPYIAPPLPPLGLYSGEVVSIYCSNSSPSAQKTQSVPVAAGRHYLITARCSDNEARAPSLGTFPRNSTFTWSVNVPGIPAPLAGSATTAEHLTMIPSDGFAYFLDDFWLVSIPTNAVNPTIGVDISINSDSFPPVYTFGLVYMDVRVIPFDFAQYNMPTNALPPTLGSTDFGAREEVKLAEGGTAFITGEPNPPALGATLLRTDLYNSDLYGLTLAWHLDIQTERPDYRTNSTMRLDDRSLPANGTYHTPTLDPRSCYITGELMNNEIIGGKCALTIQATDIQGTIKSNKFNFFIKGLNPTDLAVTNYIHTLVSASPVLGAGFSPIARAMVWNESMDTPIGIIPYVGNQYNVAGTNKWLAFKGNNGSSNATIMVNGILTTIKVTVTNWGWGICQIDRSSTGGHATTAEVYNWKTNCISGVKIMEDKWRVHTNQMDRIRAFWQPKGKWTDPSSMVYTNANGVTMSAKHYCTMVHYNGAGGLPPTQYATKIVNGKQVAVYLQSPLHFDPEKNPYPYWKFADNQKGYAGKICKEIKNPTSARE